MSLFPVPVSGQPIPRGWFARLVRFMNTLVLHGDGSYTQVKHTNNGTFVTLTTAAVDALNRAAGTPGGGGSGASGLEATVSGGTASVQVAGVSPLIVKPANANIQISGGTNGELEIGASAVTGMPNYFYPSPQSIHVDASAPVVVPSQTETMWLIGTAGVYTSSNMSGVVSVTIGYLTLTLFDLTIGSSSSLSGLTIPVALPVPAGHSFQLNASGSAAGNFYLFPTL